MREERERKREREIEKEIEKEKKTEDATEAMGVRRGFKYANIDKNKKKSTFRKYKHYNKITFAIKSVE